MAILKLGDTVALDDLIKENEVRISREQLYQVK